VGKVSRSNSLVGSTANDILGGAGVTALSDGNYVVRSRNWDLGALLATDSGAVTLGNGGRGSIGAISAQNSVLGKMAGGGENLVFTYDAPRRRLIVGHRGDNIVTILSDLALSGATQ
jgi:hypothetical protein